MASIAGLLHLDYPLLGNPLSRWLAALGVALALILFASLLRRLVVRMLSKLAARTATRLDDFAIAMLQKTSLWLVAVPAVWAASQLLVLPPKLESALAKLATVAIFLQVGLWCARLLELWATRAQPRSVTDSTSATASFGVLVIVGRALLWALILLLTLQNLGVNVNALVASLGIGGVAVALAVQNILGDLFASLSIVLDKPFEAGDFIIVDDYMGTVEHIGLKSTRMRSLGGEQIVLSNGDLLKSRMRNYKRMQQRRVVFGFGVTYQTPSAKIESIPALLRRIVEKSARTRFERAHCSKFGESSIDFEVVYWVLDADYNLYMDTQQAIIFELKRSLEAEGVEFAFPTRTVIIERPQAMPAA